ncbi:hypothetical protein GCM10023189_49000 [Nibrella saemangeumensis]|uniref:Lipoprotein n=1 Tax=Nibrella saemangeumensis TaxID=1084526 RepID=A0ABP8NHT4_9BACT
MRWLYVLLCTALVGCNQYQTIDSNGKKMIITADARANYEADLSKVAYTVSVEKSALGREAVGAAKARLAAMGIPFLFEEIDQLRQTRSWTYIDSIFVANQPQIEADPLGPVIKEHVSQIILRDFNLVLQPGDKASARIVYYVKCLVDSDSPHPGLVYIGINRLTNTLTPQERIQLAESQYNRSAVFMEKDAQNFRKMRASLDALPEEERNKMGVGVYKLLGLYDEVAYFMPKLKELMP